MIAWLFSLSLAAMVASGGGASPTLEAVDAVGDGDAARRKQMSACAGHWSVQALQDEFRRQAIHYCMHGAHVGEFQVSESGSAGNQRGARCRLVTISAEITCRSVQR